MWPLPAHSIGDPFLVVLDEPNSNLDSDGEEALTQAISGVRTRGGIVIVIAHRANAIAAVDQILVLNQGRQQAFGPRDEILRQILRPAAPPLTVVGRRGRSHMTAAPSPSRSSIRRHLLLGTLVAAGLLASIAGWAATAELAGAVIAKGIMVVESDVKKVQHPTGGIVGELRVHDDQHVNEGDIVVRLDGTQTKANLDVYTKGLDELFARRARLEAEKDGAQSIQFPDDLLARESTDSEVAHILAGERKLFSLRLEAREGEKAQLKERVTQLKQQVSGISEQLEAKAQQVALIEEELKGVLELWKKKLIQFTRVTSLKRDAAGLGGERGQLIAAKAEIAGKIAEVELQIIQVDQDARSKVAEELSDVRAKISEFSERKIAAEDQLKHATHALVNSYSIGPGYDPTMETQTIDSDWALLKLTNPLPVTIRPLATVDTLPLIGTHLMMGSYARGRRYVMTVDTDCRLMGKSSKRTLLEHNCRVAPGSSGAPLLMINHNTAVIVGMQIAIGKLNGSDIMLAVSAESIRSRTQK